ncbi:hypothetical protein, partial [Mycobacterium marinum]|uniref:hypothetical protein n=1 Tax=Mycobacterium marinum TaxID=1781 RepID=UPI001C3DCCC7
MTTKLTKLTKQQQERMAPHAQKWIQHGLRTQPLTPEEWAHWETGMRQGYEYANIPWHNNIIHVASPLVGALAAPIAAYLISSAAGDGAVDGAVDGSR